MNLASRYFAPRYFAPRYFGTRRAAELGGGGWLIPSYGQPSPRLWKLTASGGMRLRGEAIADLLGSLISSIDSPANGPWSLVGTGGLRPRGTAKSALGRCYRANGGGHLSGTAAFTALAGLNPGGQWQLEAAGGLRANGAAIVARLQGYRADGGLHWHGHAGFSELFAPDSIGGLRWSGIADVRMDLRWKLARQEDDLWMILL